MVAPQEPIDIRDIIEGPKGQLGPWNCRVPARLVVSPRGTASPDGDSSRAPLSVAHRRSERKFVSRTAGVSQYPVAVRAACSSGLSPHGRVHRCFPQVAVATASATFTVGGRADVRGHCHVN